MKLRISFWISISIFIFLTLIKSFVSAEMISVNCNDKSELTKFDLEKGKPLRDVVDKDFFKLFEKMKKFKARIDNYRLEEFKDKVLSVNVFSVPIQHSLLGWGNYSIRQEAANFDNCIVVSQDLLGVSEKSVKELSLFLLLHEAMGAAGFSDLNFQFTSVLMMPDIILRDYEVRLPVIHSVHKKSQNRREQLFQVFSSNEPILLADGGGSVVGGGGDSLLLSLKTQMLTQVFSKAVLDFQFKMELNSRQTLMAFFNFIRNASIDYVEEILLMGDSVTDITGKAHYPLVLNSVDQQLIPGVSELRKPVLVIPVGENSKNQYGFQVYLTQLILLRNLTVFMQSVQSRSLLHSNVDLKKFEVDDYLRKFLEKLVEQAIQNDFLLKKQFQLYHKRLGSNDGAGKVANQLKVKIVNDLYVLVRKNKEILSNMTEQISLTADLGNILLMSELYRDFETIMGVSDSHFYQLPNEDKD